MRYSAFIVFKDDKERRARWHPSPNRTRCDAKKPGTLCIRASGTKRYDDAVSHASSFFSSRRHVSLFLFLSFSPSRFPIRVYENAHLEPPCRLTTGVSSLFSLSLSLSPRACVCATGHRKIYGIHSIGRYEPGRVHQPSGGTFQSQTFLPSASRLGNEHDLGRKVDERVLSQSEMFTRDER